MKKKNHRRSKQEEYMRNIIKLSKGWKFLKHDMDVEDAMSNANRGEDVTVPHTWNNIDGQDGGNDYHRGRCWYIRTLSTEEICGEKVFLEINGAANISEVYLNGKKLGEHEGGFSCYRIELTDELSKENILAIAVSNEESDKVYPQKADFTFYGGLYRDVNIINTPKEHFELIKDGSLGIKVTPKVDIGENKATVLVETWQNASKVTIRIDDLQKEAVVNNGYAKAEFVIENVHLWNGTIDPYLYTAEAELSSGDKISTRFGCRTFETDPDKGFILNGKVYPLRGVSRHQDLKGKGNALSLEDHKRDMDIIKEIGANTIRLAHYQHAQEFYDLCDEEGMVVWAEIPYITMHMSNGIDNTLSQMRELITQCYNHPSIAVWGLSNEITAASAVNDELIDNHRRLNELCHDMDSTRQTVMANVFMLETDSPILDVADINSYNLYFGWYLGDLEQNDDFFDEYHSKYPNRVIGFSEYGADANIAYHSSSPQKGDYTEEYQALYHEHILEMIDKRPYLWATHVWNMFDFGADGRDEGGKNGENQKGLVTFDRKERKDAFYLYKAAWNKKEPFVHICGRRYINRNEDTTEIKVYSNQSKVALYMDGVKIDEQEGERVFRFTCTINGTHKVVAQSQDASDEIEIKYVAEPDETYIFNKAVSNVSNWFDSEQIDKDCFSINDKLEDLQAHPKAGQVVKSMMDKASEARGDVAQSVKDNPQLQRMMGKMTLISLLKQAGSDEESIKQLNRILQGIKK